MNIKNAHRDEYIFTERQKGRTYKDIGQEFGITPHRVRQVCVYVARQKRQEYFKTHPDAYEEWRKSPMDKKWNSLPIE